MFIHVVIRRGWSLEHVAPILQHLLLKFHIIRLAYTSPWWFRSHEPLFFVSSALISCALIDIVTPQTIQKHIVKMNPLCSLQRASISIYTYSQFFWWSYLMLLVSIIWIVTPYDRIYTNCTTASCNSASHITHTSSTILSHSIQLTDDDLDWWETGAGANAVTAPTHISERADVNFIFNYSYLYIDCRNINDAILAFGRIRLVDVWVKEQVEESKWKRRKRGALSWPRTSTRQFSTYLFAT